MVSPAYAIGALDALVKAGEMSQAYADGARSVLEKEAIWYIPTTWGGGSPYPNYQREMDKFIKDNPGRYSDEGKLTISPDEAQRLIRDSRPKGDNYWGRKGIWWNNRLRKWTRWWPTVPEALKNNPNIYDRQLADDYNREELDYIKREMSRPAHRLDPEVAAALQDAYVRDADYRVQDAKDYMSDTERQAKGLDDNYAAQYRTALGVSASTGGLYKPKYDVPKRPTTPRYGDNMPDVFGDNRSLFYRRPVN